MIKPYNHKTQEHKKMKAIDFSCRLLLRLQEDDLSSNSQRVLIALAAGLETSRDIGQNCQLSSQASSAVLSSLERAGLVLRLATRKPSEYQLSPQGRERIRSYLSFLPMENMPNP